MYIFIRGKRWHLSRYEIRLIKKAAASVLIMIITFAVMRWACDYAYYYRGYEAYGGEWLLPVYALVINSYLWHKVDKE